MEEIQQNSPDALCVEILAAASREAGEIRHAAEIEAASVLSKAAAEAEKIRRETIEQAQIRAKKQTETILETVKVEKRRMRAARVEGLLESMRDDMRKSLEARNDNSHETIISLAVEAISNMPADDLVLTISGEDNGTYGNGLAEKIIRRARRPQLRLTISTNPTMTGGDVTVQDTGGLQFWDNRLKSRLERLWPELRRQIAVAGGLIKDNHGTGGQL
jgi:vacuolar-type H+-ATPase subunit E/Vma4